MTVPALTPAPLPTLIQPTTDPHARLREVAHELEAAFLSEMLRHAGLGEARESFGGGIGEEQMSSMMRTQHADALTQRGGIGLAEQIFQSLVRREAAGQ